MDKQRRLILPKPWRLSTDKIAKVAKEGEESKGDAERPAEPDELTYFFLLPWVLNGKKVIYVFDQDQMALASAAWDNISPFSLDQQFPFSDFVRRIQMVSLDCQWRFAVNNNLTKYANLPVLAKDGVAFSGSWHWGILQNAAEDDANSEMDGDTLKFMNQFAAHQLSRQEKLEDAAANRGFPPGMMPGFPPGGFPPK